MISTSNISTQECNPPSDSRVNISRVKNAAKDYPTDSSYEGSWDLFGMNGHGIYIFPNGVVYEGEFDDGTFHGKGELRYPSGAILRGSWRHGDITERTLIFPDGLEYSEIDWKYCRMPDRRFTIEYENGVQPAGLSYLTADQPTREIPEGYYDTGDGFYDPKTKLVYKADDLTYIIRSPGEPEQKWIVDNCRASSMKPLGHRPEFYEEWSEPQVVPKNPPCSAASSHARLQLSAHHHVESVEGGVHSFSTERTTYQSMGSPPVTSHISMVASKHRRRSPKPMPRPPAFSYQGPKGSSD